MSLSQKTVKLPGYKKKPMPDPGSQDTQFHMKLLAQIIFGLFAQKKQELAAMGWPPQPIHQNEIYEEYKARVKRYKQYDKKHQGKNRYWPPFAQVHLHNWIERRVNYLATPAFGPKNETDILLIVSPSDGLYEPNPALFK